MLNIRLSYIKKISVLYLAFPYFIFFLGWLKPVIAIALCLLLGYGLFAILKDNYQHYKRQQVSVNQLVIIGFILLIWLLLSGTGGFGYQNHDYYKHNALMKDLMVQPWPVKYSIGGSTFYLSHYLAYYIVGPSVGFLLGWKIMHLAIFGFTFVGLALICFWFLRFVGSFSWTALLVLIFFSGVTIFSIFWEHGSETLIFLKNQIKNHGYFYWLNGLKTLLITYPNLTDSLYWAPQHTIPCWLATAMLINDGFIDKNLKYTPFYLALVALWAPLVLIGILPLFILALIQCGLGSTLNLHNFVLAPIFFLVSAIYLLSIDSGGLINHFIFDRNYSGGHLLVKQLSVYFYFILMEFGLFAFLSLILLKHKINSNQRQLLWFLILVLSLTPLFRYGQWNDWCGRVSMPSIFVLTAFVAKSIHFGAGRYRYLLTGILFIAAIGPFCVISSSLYGNNFSIKFKPAEYQFVGDLPSASVGFPVTQFVAKEDTFFYKYLGKN